MVSRCDRKIRRERNCREAIGSDKQRVTGIVDAERKVLICLEMIIVWYNKLMLYIVSSGILIYFHSYRPGRHAPLPTAFSNALEVDDGKMSRCYMRRNKTRSFVWRPVFNGAVP